jgi:hypothetical protein
MGDDVASTAQMVLDALRDLPAAERDRLHERLADVVAEYQRTNDVRAVDSFFLGLLTTARLHRNPAYRKNLVEVDDQLAEEVAAAIPVGEAVKSLRIRCS